MTTKDWQPTPAQEEEFSERLGRLLGMVDPELLTSLESEVYFAESGGTRFAKLTATIGKRAWRGVFVYHDASSTSKRGWYMRRFDPMARPPEDVYSPVTHLVSRARRSKMVLMLPAAAA